MKIFRRFKKLGSSYQGASVAMGNFDGLHLGHAGVIKRAAEIANSRGVPLGIVTFEPHPVTVLRPKLQLRRLAPFRTKVRLLKEFGVEILYMLPFSKEFSQLSASQFVTEVLVKKLQSPTASKEPQPSKNQDIINLQNQLSEKLGAAVKIDHSSKGCGKLIISYNSVDELDGILDHLK